MKITIVTNGFPPQRWAGTETYSAGIASFLANNGHQVNVICAGEWEDGPNNVNGFSHDYYNGIGVYRINLNWTKGKDPFTYLYNNPEVSSLLSRLLNDTKPDIIHVTSCETLSASLFGVAKKLGIPLVLTLTDFWFICPRINLLKSNGENCSGSTTAWECLRCQLLDSKVFRFPNEFLPEYLVSKLFMSISKNSSITKQRGLRGFAGDMEKRKKFLSQAIYWPDVRITASQFVSDIFLDHFNDLPITLLPYGHDLSWIKEGLHKAESQKIRFGFIGQIIPSKGVDILINAIKEMSDEYRKKVICKIFGKINPDSDYSKHLSDLAGREKNIQFCGIYPHEDSAKIFSEIDILVVPSIWYDFPLIIHEAFATRTPVVASNLAGMAETIRDGVDGFLFERKDISGLASILKKIVDEPGLVNHLREGIKPVLRMNEHVEQLEKIYTTAIIKKNQEP